MRTLFLVVILCISAVVARAEYQVPDRYWDMMLRGNINEIERELDALHDQVRSGEVDYEFQRWVYVAFSSTHPDIIELLNRWRDERPDSRHLLAGWMWHHHHLSFIARGNRTARYTHTEAMGEYRRLGHVAHEAAERLIEEHPDFVPGTDGTFRLMLSVANRRLVNRHMDRVFEYTPNAGSLQRALDAFAPKWGGSWEKMFGLCDRYGSQINEFDPEVCKAKAVFDENVGGVIPSFLARATLSRKPDAFDPIYTLIAAIDHDQDVDKALALAEEIPDIPYGVAFRLGQLTGNWKYHYDAEERLWEDRLRMYERDPLNPKFVRAKLRKIKNELDLHRQAIRNGLEEERTRMLVEFGFLRDGETDLVKPMPEDPNHPIWIEMTRINDALNQTHVADDEKSKELTRHIRSLANDLRVYGTRDPDALAEIYYVGFDWRDRSNRLDRLRILQDMLIYSNFSPSYFDTFERNVSSSYSSLSVLTELGEDLTPDQRKWESTYGCELVRIYRMVEDFCPGNCPSRDMWDRARNFIAKARDEKICLEMLNASSSTIYFEDR